jgi:hypothetical protein
MKRLVNYTKRSVQLPKGCKDLADVLKSSRHPSGGHAGFLGSIRNAKCEYCGGQPVGGSTSWMSGAPEEEAHFWCERCQHDLLEFDSKPENALPEDIDFEDAALVKRLTFQIEDIEKCRDEFMRRRVAERKGTA